MNFNYIKENIIFEDGTAIIASSGPSAIEILTYNVYKDIKMADVVIYDALVNQNVLNFAQKKSKLICARKTYSDRACSQNDINKWIVKFSKKKLKVLRLKGGDTSFFSRLSQEVKFLKKNQINFKIFTGITAAQESLRVLKTKFFNDSNACNFITGHRMVESTNIQINYKMFCKNKGKIIIYMGIGQIKNIRENLLRFGKRLNSKVLVVTNVSLKNEKIFVTNLKNSIEFFKSNAIKPPGIIVIE